MTGGSNGIGETIIQRVGERYLAVANYDFSIAPELDVRNYRRLREHMDKCLKRDQFQNDLVVCAGVIVPKPFLELTPEDIEFQSGTNLEGAMYTVHAFLSWHSANNHLVTPNIVVISSVSAHLHEGPDVAVYEASKAGLSHFAKSLVDPTRRKHIINVIEPGTIRQTRIGGWRPDVSFDQSARERIEEAQAKEVSMLRVEPTKNDVAKVAEKLLFDNQEGTHNGKSFAVYGMK